MNRFRRLLIGALIAVALLGVGVAAYPPGPTFNPQPDPPGVTFNPQPDPPGATDYPPGPYQTAGVIMDQGLALFPPGPYKTAGIII